MTSPGLKRPLDLDIKQQHTSAPVSTNSSGNATNGNKRRCTNYSAQTRADNNNLSAGHNSSIFREPSTIISSFNDELAAMIKDEVNRANDSLSNDVDPPVLSVRQTQVICEKLVREREQRLRDEYDRILGCKLAEQYDLLTKANYLNSYADSRMPSVLTPPANNPSINALAAAFTSMQRNTTPAASATSPIPDLSTFAASLSANGHPSALNSRHLAYNLQKQAAAVAIQAQQHRVSLTGAGAFPLGPVLLASNLDEQLSTPEALFTLFGVFGDVVRVKILFNKKDNALIQMADANQAHVAQGYLDKQKIFGKNIRVTRSKHQLVQMPREGNQSDTGLTKDFTNSPLHRFKIPGSRNYLNIYPPSNTVHISNIPATIDEKDLREAFKEACGFEYASFKFFPKDRKMALMKFNSIEHATIALIKMHNYQISEDNNLRVSFSKSVMQQ